MADLRRVDAPAHQTGAPTQRLNPSQELAKQGSRSHADDCDCHCWHCTVGPAVDRAVVTGHRVTIDATDQVVIPDVLAVELAANGINVDDHGSYRVTHRSGNRTCWILSPGAVL